MTIKNMIVFKLGERGGFKFTEDNISMESFNNLPILHGDKIVGICLNAKIKNDKVIGKVAWWDEIMDCKPKKQFGNCELYISDDGKYTICSISIDNLIKE